MPPSSIFKKLKPQKMNITTIVITILITVICILLGILQHLYGSYIQIKKIQSIKPSEPVFEDLIPTVIKKNYDFDINEESEISNSLNDILKAPTTSENPLIMSPNNNIACESEAHNSLLAALSFKSVGKLEKAMKLFEHAAYLAPDNADILNRYGEFLEVIHDNVVAADELYFKALTYSPFHEAALTNRLRTADIVDKLDLEVFKNIDQKRDVLKNMQIKNSVYDIVKQEAYYLHIYHTVGIEGNTMTLEQLKYVLETGQAVQGKSIVEHNEILGLELAMKYVKLLTQFPAIEVNEILGIHRRVLGHVDPISSGTFRDKQVFIGSHVPPLPEDVLGLMESYVEWLNSEEARHMHPVRYAALAHYKLVDIHPFVDGNGRTSRLIMNLILIRSGYPPIMIHKHNRKKYYDYLNLANHGDVRPFVRFIAHCTERMIDAYILSIGTRSKQLTNINIPSIEMDETSEI